MRFHNTCRKPIYYSQISTRLTELRREKRRVIEHLDLLNQHIKTLERTIEIMGAEDDAVLALNSEVYSKHKVRHAVFKVRPRHTLLNFLKENAHQAYSTHELTQMLLDKESSDIALSERFMNPIRQILNKLHKQGAVSKQLVWGKTTYWQWIA